MNGFVDHLYTPFGYTSNYKTIADFHTKSSQSAFTGRCLVTALNNGCSSAMCSLGVS
jgi:hypothetical protein